VIAYTYYDKAFLAQASGAGGDLCTVRLSGAFTGGGDTFDCYQNELLLVTTLTHGNGFSAAWVIDTNYFGPQGGDTYESYSVGSIGPSTVLAEVGNQMTGSWSITGNYTGYGSTSSGSEVWEEYPDYPAGAANAAVLNYGSGYVAPWVFSTVGSPDGVETFEEYGTGRVITGNTTFSGLLNLSTQVPNWVGWPPTQSDSFNQDLYGNGFNDITAMAVAGQQLYLYVRATGFSYGGPILMPSGTYTLIFKTCGNPADTDAAIGVMVCDWASPIYYWQFPNYPESAKAGGIVMDGSIFVSHVEGITEHSFQFTVGTSGTKYVVFNGTSGGCAVDDIVVVNNGTGTVYTQNFNDGNPSYLGGLDGGNGWLGPWVVTSPLVPPGTFTADGSITPADFAFGSVPVNITITGGTSGENYFYTTDGSVPTTASTPYSGAIQVLTPTELRVICTKDGCTSSFMDGYFPLKARAWWSARLTTGLNDGDIVSFVPDQSGNGFALRQATGGIQPHYRTNLMNGWPAFHFAGTNSEYLSADDFTSGLTEAELWAVFMNQNTGDFLTGHWFFTASDTTPHIPFTNDNFVYEGFASTTRPASTYTLNGSLYYVPLAYNAQSSATGFSQYANGNNLTINRSNSVGWPSPRTDLAVGRGHQIGTWFYYSGWICEIIVFDHVLTTTERRSVMSYLNNIYGFNLT
jgi:hypothetical protein